MNVSRYALAAAAVAALVATPRASARAQQASTIHFGASGGVSIPLSDLSRNSQIGYTIGGLVQGTPQTLPFALRGEFTYTSFAGRHGYVSENVTGIGVNAVVPLAPAGDAPYFIGGVALNHTSEFAGLTSENDFGFNFGGGVKWQLGDMSSFIELRYVYVAHSNSSRQMLPLTFGVLF